MTLFKVFAIMELSSWSRLWLKFVIALLFLNFIHILPSRQRATTHSSSLLARHVPESRILLLLFLLLLCFFPIYYYHHHLQLLIIPPLFRFFLSFQKSIPQSTAPRSLQYLPLHGEDIVIIILLRAKFKD